MYLFNPLQLPPHLVPVFLGGAGGDGGGGGVWQDGLIALYESASGVHTTNLWETSIEAGPADGLSNTAYSMYGNGTEAADGGPVFVGANEDFGPHYTFSNTCFRMLDGTPFTRSMHKATAQWTIATAFEWSGTLSANMAPIFDSGSLDYSGSDTSRGILFCDLGAVNAASKFNFRIKQDSGGSSQFAVDSDAAIPANTPLFLAASVDCTNDVDSFLYRNGAFDPVGGSNTFTISGPGFGVADAYRPSIGGRGDMATKLAAASGVKLRFVAIWNRPLSKEELDEVYAILGG